MYNKAMENIAKMGLEDKIEVVLTDAGEYMKQSDYNEHKHRTATNRLREYLEIMKEDPRLESELIMVGDGLAISKVK